MNVFYNPYGVHLFTRLRLDLSHLSWYKFKNDFNDTINPICICGMDIELINYFFLGSLEFCEARQTILENIQSIEKTLIQNESTLTCLFLYSDLDGISSAGAFFLNSATEFILYPGIFSELLSNEA